MKDVKGYLNNEMVIWPQEMQEIILKAVKIYKCNGVSMQAAVINIQCLIYHVISVHSFIIHTSIVNVEYCFGACEYTFSNEQKGREKKKRHQLSGHKIHMFLHAKYSL